MQRMRSWRRSNEQRDSEVGLTQRSALRSPSADHVIPQISWFFAYYKYECFHDYWYLFSFKRIQSRFFVEPEVGLRLPMETEHKMEIHARLQARI